MRVFGFHSAQRFLRGTLSGLVVFGFLLIQLAGSLARGQSDQTWINGSAVWDLTSPHWDGGVAWTNGNNAIFGGASETITLGDPITVNDLTFNSSGFLITGTGANVFTLAANSLISVTTAGHLATINAVIASGGFTKSGAGTLILGGNNSFGGNVLVNSGVLRITHASALGSTVGTTTVASGARLELSGGITVTGETITINGSGGNNLGALQSVGGANVWAGNILLGATSTRLGAVGAGNSLTVSGVIDDGANTFALAVRNADAGGEVILTGENTYGGPTDVVVGVLKIDGGNDRLPVGTTLRIGNGSNVAFATFDLNGFNQQVAGLVDFGTTMDRTVTNTSATASTLTVSSSSSSIYAGVVAGNLNLLKADSGTLTLSGNNTHTGTTTVNGGTLNFAGASSATGQVIVNTGAIGLVSHNEGLGSTSAGTVVNSGGRLVLANGVTVTGETITITGTGGNNNGALQTADGATATWDGNILLAGSMPRMGGGVGGTLIVNGVISGTTGVLFSRGNDATTILNAVNTYTGDTQMFANGGTRATLRIGVDNAISPLSQLSTINAGATRPMDLDLNGHVLTLRALDTSVRHENGAFIFILNNGASPSVFTVSGASGSTNFTGILADGSGGLSFVKSGASTQILLAVHTYTGTTTVNAGTLQIGGSVSTFGVNGSLASTQLFLKGGILSLDNLGANNNSANRIADNAVLTFEGGTLVYRGSDQAATNSTETVGTLLFARSISTATFAFGGTNLVAFTAALLSRPAGGGIGFINGINLGRDGSSTTSVSRVFLTTTPLLVGTSDALASGINAAAKDTKIVPFLIGSATATSGGLGTAATVANTFLTYHPDTGLRPLNPTDEFTANAIVDGDNIRLTADTTATTTANINSLLIEGTVILTISSGQTLTVDSGAILFVSGSGPAINGPGILDFGSREGLITINSTGNTFIRSRISGTAGVTYHGTGTLVLGTQQSTYSGDTVLRVANVIPQGSSVGPAGAPTSGPFGTGRLILDGSAIRATTANAITIDNELVIRADTTILSSGGAQDLIFTGPVTLEGGDRTIVHNSSANTIFSGVIGDGGEDLAFKVAGTGSGAVILSGANTYTGGTTVEGATLLVNNTSGSGTGSGSVTVNDGGTLGGNGTIVTASSVIESGGILSPGDPGVDGGVGTLSFTGGLTSESGSIWLIDIVRDQDGVSDRVDVSGALVITGTTLDLAFTGDFQYGNVYTIASYGSLTGTFDGWDEDEVFFDYRINYGSGVITLTAVPEPGTLLVLGAVFGGLALRRFRRRARIEE